MARERPVTGTILRDMVVCERRVWHDAHTDAVLRDEVGSFVRMLWAEGCRHEEEVLSGLAGTVVDLRREAAADRRAATLRALRDPRADHILGAELVHGDLLGRPDVVSRVGGNWVCGDAKSGTPFMPDGVRVREEYGVQIGLYAKILSAISLGDGGRAFVIGPDGGRTMFDLDAPWGRSSMSAIVEMLVGEARDVLDGVAPTRGAAAARCGMCHWRTLCRGELEAADDLTLVAELGRGLRSVLEGTAPTRSALASLDLDKVSRPDGRAGLPGLGPARLARLRDRARLQLTAGAPYARIPLGLARAPLEFHLDIESDPTRAGLVYLHGIWERRIGAGGFETARFVHFFADGADGERGAFEGAWRFLTAAPDAMVYHYSPFERTAYRDLQRRHPDVCTAQEVEDLFASPRTIDLYADAVRPHTEWPLGSYGLKPIAKLSGFRWSAEDASGASSIAWHDEYARTGDPAVRDRIIEYNRQDCEASAVVLDALIALPVGIPPWPPEEAAEDSDHRAHSDPPVHDGARADTTSAEDPADAAWRAEGEDLNRYFTELAARTPSPPEGPAGAGAPRPMASTATWSSPTLRPCVALGPRPDDGSGREDRPARACARLATDLPLLGAEAMRPGPGGGMRIGAALRAEFPWMEVAIATIERQLEIACWTGRPWLCFRPLCLVGPPGVGKSHFARRLASLAGVGSAALDLGAMHDAAALVAVSRGWSSAKPCWPAQMMDALGCANPVLVLDELEKAGGSRRNGDPQQALLAMTEPGTARRYFDACLGTEVDLSAVCWIATANSLDGVAAPLASRFEMVAVDPPGAGHFDLALAGVVAALGRSWAVPAGMLPTIPARARSTLRAAFVRTRSLRSLTRHVEMVVHALLVDADRPLN